MPTRTRRPLQPFPAGTATGVGTASRRGARHSGHGRLFLAEAEFHGQDPVGRKDTRGEADQDGEYGQHVKKPGDDHACIAEVKVLGHQERMGEGDGQDEDLHRQGNGVDVGEQGDE